MNSNLNNLNKNTSESIKLGNEQEYINEIRRLT